MESNPDLLSELLINPSPGQLAIYLRHDSKIFVPQDVSDSFDMVDESLSPRRIATFEDMLGSVAVLPKNLVIATFSSQQQNGPRQAMIRLSPLSDEIPTSSPKEIHTYCSQTTEADKTQAQPNSWRPLANLHGTGQLSTAEKLNLTHIQLFQPDADAMTSHQRLRVISGDGHPYGELVENALQFVEDRQGHPFDIVHFFAAGLSLKAFGAADYFVRRGLREVGSVTAMNFAVDPNPLRALYSYMARSTAGQPSDYLIPADYRRIDELAIATTLDKLGAEKAMRRRQVKAFRRFMMLSSLVSARRAPEYIENLLQSGVSITLANAINESLTQRTLGYIGDTSTRNPLFHNVNIVGVKDTKTGMMTNEFFALTALVTHLGLRNYRNDSNQQ